LGNRGFPTGAKRRSKSQAVHQEEFKRSKEVVISHPEKSILDRLSDNATSWIGSTSSLLVHTLFFVGIFSLYFLHVNFDAILLILTTIVSLEAIYLAIFIQRAVNRHQENIDDIEESIDDIEEDIEDITEDLDDVQKEHDDISNETVKKLEQPLDEVVPEIRESLHELVKEIHLLKKEKK